MVELLFLSWWSLFLSVVFPLVTFASCCSSSQLVLLLHYESIYIPLYNLCQYLCSCIVPVVIPSIGPPSSAIVFASGVTKKSNTTHTFGNAIVTEEKLSPKSIAKWEYYHVDVYQQMHYFTEAQNDFLHEDLP